MPGRVVVVRHSSNIPGLRALVEQYRDDGFDIDLVIIDYGDKIPPVRQRSDKWIELGEIFDGLKMLAVDLDLPVWTATQTGRQAVNKTVITMADLAESFRKADAADAMIAICQTQEEEAAEQCRLYLAKMRKASSRRMIRAKYIKAQQAIISTEFVGEDD